MFGECDLLKRLLKCHAMLVAHPHFGSKNLRIFFIVVISVWTLSYSPFLLAESKKKKSATVGASQAAVVKTDSVTVYSKPDFDAPAISYLSAGQNVRVSKRQYGSVQKFFKLRLPNGKMGYVSTIDVNRAGGDDESDQANGKDKDKEKEKGTGKDKADDQENKSRQARYRHEMDKPMIFNRWIGLLGGSLAFKEKIKGAKGEDELIIYGLKVSGPDILLEGPIMDLNLFLHIGAPDYYNDLSKIKPTGFVFMTDALLIFPLTNGQNSSVYFGGGPLFKFSSFKYINLAGAPKNPQQFALGGSGVIGLGLRMGGVALRGEAKYIAERTTQIVYQLSLQTFY